MAKPTILFIHGGEAFSTQERYLEHLRTGEIKDPFVEHEKPVRWTQTLREDLGEGFSVLTPTMPNKHKAAYEEWKIWFERHLEFVSEDVILVGWSLGGQFLVKYLAENATSVPVKALFVLAAPFHYFESADCPEDGGDFYFASKDVPTVGEKVENIHILHSTDDFVVPYEHATEYAAALPQATLHTFEDKNHFLVEALPELLELIREVAGE